ncbi:ATP-binding protein [Helicovermis profundi]
MFVGRKKELEFLQEKYTSKKAEFIVLYGRRRIGKTALIREFVKDKNHIFYSAVQITDNVQLNKMSNIVINHYNAQIYNTQFSDWEALFRFISDQTIYNKKMVIVMDEFPYMVQNNKSIPSVLQNHWDHYFSKLNIMIIICGSSMSFMEKEILSEKNPLYGRTTGIYKVRELDFESSRAFMGKGNLKEHLNYYSVFSGVPYYLSLINPKDTFEINLKKNILSNGSVLFNEIEFLLKQELREVSNYNAIIESIALGDSKLNDIYQKTKIEKTKLPFYINSLIDLGIIKKEYSATIKIKEQVKKRSGIYKIDNGYFRFHYSFVYPYLSELLEGSEDIIIEDVIRERMLMFVSNEFEKISIEYVRKMGIEKKLPIRPIKIGKWWDKNQEIDILAFDINNNFIFGECKWRNEKVGVKILNQLKLKSDKIEITPKKSYYILFSKSGFTSKLIECSKREDNLFLVDYSKDVVTLI